MEEVLEFLNECGIFYIATVEDDQPRVRPFGIAEIYDNHLYIQTGKRKNVSKQIAKNPKVEICASKGTKWLRVTGTLKRDDRIETKKAMLDKNPHLRKMYDENDDNTETLYFENVIATFSSFTEEPRVIEL